MKILLANDDGVRAQGLLELADELKKIGEVTVIAPDAERSAAGHSVTFFAPLRLVKLSEEANCSIYSCSGTPSDCVIMGLAHVMKNTPPDVVITGINYGPNLGDDVTYSGTISSAMEGAQAGIPSIAISTGVTKDRSITYKTAAKVGAEICKMVYKNKLPNRTLLNVNVPCTPEESIKGIKITHLGVSNFKYGFIQRQDAGERDYYWLTREPRPQQELRAGSDYEALENNYISITPIQLSFTANEIFPQINKWGFENFKI